MITRTRADAGLVVARRTTTVAGHERAWVEVSSATERAADRRLLIAAHGSNQSPKVLRSLSGYTFDDWARAGHVVVYPRSWRGGLWNDARTSTPSRARADGVDDVAFIQALADQYLGSAAEGITDAYGIGYSNGGQLLIRVVLETQLLTAAGLVSATMPAPTNLLAAIDPDSRAIPMMLVHGTKDPIVPFRGGMASVLGRPRGLMRSFDDSVAFWADRAGITTAPLTQPLDEDGRYGAGGRRLTYIADDHPTVVAFAMADGGHLIPNRRRAGNFLMGHGNHSIDTMTEFTQLVEAIQPKTHGS